MFGAGGGGGAGGTDPRMIVPGADRFHDLAPLARMRARFQLMTPEQRAARTAAIEEVKQATAAAGKSVP